MAALLLLMAPPPCAVAQVSWSPADASGAIAVGGAFQPVLSADSGRVQCRITNNDKTDTAENLYIYDKASGTPSAANSTVLEPGGVYFCASNNTINQGAIQVMAPTTGHTFEAAFGPGPNCPYGAANPDGCSQAAVGGSFRDSAFVLDATQNGQPSMLPTHPMPWNLAGADYPVGPTITRFTTIAAYVAAGNLSGTGCVYEPGNGGANGAKRVLCTNATSIDFEGIDFTNGNTECVTLETSGTLPSTITIKNDIFGAMGGKCGSPTFNTQNGWFVKINAPGTGLTHVYVLNNLFDGNPPGCGTICYSQPIVANVIDNATVAQTLTMQYNAFINNEGRDVNANGNPIDFEFKYNYTYALNMGYDTSQNHGEFNSITPIHGSTGNVMNVDYNTFVIPNNEPYQNSTTTIYASTGSSTSEWALESFIGNTVITNCTQHNGKCSEVNATAGIQASYNQIDALAIENNYIDPNGGLNCIEVAEGASPTSGGSGYTQYDIVTFANGGKAEIVTVDTNGAATKLAVTTPAPTANLGTSSSAAVSGGTGSGLVADWSPWGAGIVSPTFSGNFDLYGSGSQLNGFDTTASSCPGVTSP